MSCAARTLAVAVLLSLTLYWLLLYTHMAFMVFHQPLSLQGAAMLDALRGLAAQTFFFLSVAAACLAVFTCLQQQRRGRASVLALLVILAQLLYLVYALVPSLPQVFGDTLGIIPQAYTEVIPGFMLAGIALVVTPRPQNSAAERE